MLDGKELTREEYLKSPAGRIFLEQEGGERS